VGTVLGGRLIGHRQSAEATTFTAAVAAIYLGLGGYTILTTV
jgi:hypothetical protein